MPKDLFETELGKEPVNQTMMPRDLLGEKPQRSFSQQVNDNISDNYGFTDDDKFIIKQVFTPEEIEEFKAQKPMGLLEGIKKKGFWSALAEQRSEFKRNFHPVDALMESGKMLVDYKAFKEVTNFEPKSKEQIRKDLEELAKEYPEFKVTDELVEKQYMNQIPPSTSYVRDAVRDMYKDQLRGTTVMGNVGNIMGEAPVFMGEIVAAGGVASVGKPLIKQAAKEAFKKSLKASSKNIAKKAAKKGIQTAAITAEVGAMATASPTMLEKNYLDRRIAGTIKATDKGEVLISEMDESPYRTAAKAFMDTSVAIGSEMSGEAIMKGVGYVAGKAGKVLSPVLAKFTASPRVAKVRDAILREARKIKPDLDMQKFMHDKVYYNGVLGEMSEERLEGVMRAALQLNDDDERSTTDQILEAMFPDSDQLLAELGAFSMMGSLPYASRVAKNFLKSKGLNEQQVEETIRNLPQTEIDKLAQQANDEAESKSGLDYLDVVRVPLYKIKLSKDIPNFKEGVNENGVVEGEQLQGEFDDLGTGPIVLWERTNGDLEVVTGRHRFDLAKRSGREDIAAQIVKESLGWDAKKVRQIDVEQNIRDDKGTVWDMARYFREDGMSLAEAVRKGLIRENAKSRAAIDIATKSSESLYSLFANKKIKADKAVAIANGAPNNEAAQAAGIKAADKMSAEELQIYTSMLNEVAKTKGASESDGDLFGFDDSSIKEMEEISKNVAKDIKAIDNKISAVRGALRNPKIAEEMGLKFDVTPENIGKEIVRLKEQKSALQKISTNPELMSKYRNELHKEGKEPPLRDAVYQGEKVADNAVDLTEFNKNIGKVIQAAKEAFGKGTTEHVEAKFPISPKILNILKNHGIDVDIRTSDVNSSFVNHALAEHGNQSVEEEHGQIAVNYNDFSKIPSVINSPDYIVIEGYEDGTKGLVFVKNMEDNTPFIVEIPSKKKQRILATTMYKKRRAIHASDLRSLNLTSKTVPVYKDIIDVKQENVNSKNDVDYQKGNENIYGATNSNKEPIANPASFNMFIEGSRVTDNDEPVSPENPPKKIYRGDTRYFEEYEAQQNAYEYDWGSGFYLSDNYEDVAENYQSKGPDLTNRIDREAEQLAQDEDIDYDEAREKVRKEYEQEDIIREFYLSIKEPVIIGGEKETFFDYSEEYNEETDEYGEPQVKLLDLIYGIENYLADIGADEYTQVITGNLYEKAIENGGLTASEVEDIVRGTEEANYLIDYESSAGEMLSSVFGSIGFDGIIDHRAGTKFKNMNMDSDTTHYIVFNSEQAKSVDNKGEWDTSNKNFYYDVVPEEGKSIEPESLGLSEEYSVEAKNIETTINTAEEVADPFRKEAKQLGWWSGIYAGVRETLFGSDANAASFEDYQEGVWSKMRRAFTDYLSGLEKINTEAYKRARVNAGLGGRVIEALTDRLTRLDKEGNIEDLGEGFIPILKDFRAEFGVSMKETEKDLGDYLVARRYLEDLQNRDDVTVTDAQIEESVNKLDALKQKYGAQVIRLQEYADRIYDYQKRLSHLLVDAELITEEKYNEMLTKNPHYVPFYRILEDNGLETDNMVRQASSGGFNRANPTIKKIKGSELDIRNPFASIVNNTVNVLRNTEKNEVARSVAALKDQYPALVRDKEPLMEHGKVKIKVSFDRGLRDALKQGIELLGAKFEKVKTLNKRGMKGLVLGEYSPQEKTVRERLGVDNALTHEFGHLLDFDLNLGRWILDAETRVELEKLAEERLNQETEAVEDDNGNIRLERKRISEPSASHMEYIKNDRELIANLYDAYINAPELLDSIAPKAKQKLETALNKSGYTWLKDIKRTLDKGVEDIEQDAWVKSRVMPSGNTISYYEKGKKKYIEVQNSLYKALNGLDKSRLPFVVRMLFVMPEQMLRRTTTMWSAAFTIRNMVRDTMEAAINTDIGFVPVLSTLRGMYDVATKSNAYKQWMAAGGSFDSFMEINENSDRNPYDELFGNMNKLQALNPLKWIEAFGTLGEQATRVSVYRLAKKRGLNDLDASILARGGTLDFARGGEWSKKANQFSAFLNASIQGVSAMTQAFKRKPVETTVKALAYITLPSILETGYYLYMASEDDREQYLELPSWRKELFWNFKVGNNWFMIPKPFTYGMVFGTIPQAVMIADYKNDKTDWKHLFEQTMGTMNPLQDTGTYLPKLIKEIIEQETNHDFFTDREIVPFYTLKQDEQYQYGDYTSEAAKKIGKAIGVSPARVEHAITSIFGTLSKDVLAASDLWKKEDAPAKEWGELPIIRGFVNPEPIGNRSQSVQDYYEMFNDAFGAQTTLNALKKKDYDAALEYEEENTERLNLYEALKPYERKRKAIMDEINKIRYSPLYMSAKEKKAQISELQRELTANAKEALKLKKDEKVLNATPVDKVKEKLFNGREVSDSDSQLINEVVRLNRTHYKPVMIDVTERTNLSLVDDKLKSEVADKYSKMYVAVAKEIIKTDEYKKADNAEKKKLLDKVRSKVVQQLKKEYRVK